MKPNNKSLEPGAASVSYRLVREQDSGQRIDNYLVKVLKGVPKSRIYKAIRGGEVRLNGGRVKVSSRIMSGDKVRIPPIRAASPSSSVVVPPRLIESIPVLYEDEQMLVVNKPSGIAVHGGTGMEFGLIEAFRQHGSSIPFLELAHRIDRETSGCLMLAKDRKTLLGLQESMTARRGIRKYYLALVAGNWNAKNLPVKFSLRKRSSRQPDPKVSEAGENATGQRSSGGERRMQVDSSGQVAISMINAEKQFRNSTLVKIELKTGRMHQARLHCSASGHPIAGDRLYGERDYNREMKRQGLGRLFLHASGLEIRHPLTRETIRIDCPLPDQLLSVLDRLDQNRV